MRKSSQILCRSSLVMYKQYASVKCILLSCYLASQEKRNYYIVEMTTSFDLRPFFIFYLVHKVASSKGCSQPNCAITNLTENKLKAVALIAFSEILFYNYLTHLSYIGKAPALLRSREEIDMTGDGAVREVSEVCDEMSLLMTPEVSEQEERVLSPAEQQMILAQFSQAVEEETEAEEEPDPELPSHARYAIDSGEEGNARDGMLILYLYGGNNAGLVKFIERLDNEVECVLRITQLLPGSDLYNMAADLSLMVSHTRGTDRVPLLDSGPTTVPEAQCEIIESVYDMLGQENVGYRPFRQS